MKISNTQFDKNPSSGSRVVPCGRMDRWADRDEDVWKDGQTDRWAERQTDRQANGQTDMTKLIVAFRNNVNANKKN